MLHMSWFKKSSNKPAFPWLELTSEEQFLQLLESEKTFAVFKHSTRCSISSMAKNRLENNWDLDENTPVYYLDLIQHRNVSNLIADKLQVTHQSPQLIVIKNKEAIYHASHNGISIEQVKAAV